MTPCGARLSRVRLPGILAACGEGAPPPPHYETAAVTRGDLKVTVEASGTIEPVATVEVKSKASGEILELTSEIGDTVEAGKLLVRIDRRTPKDHLVDQAQAELNAARQREATAEYADGAGRQLRANAWINQSGSRRSSSKSRTRARRPVAARVALENARIGLDDTERCARRLRARS